ncbi:MAG: hypothetical protein K1X67_24600 [Fimbriimonadaceae bacterium]|nr:hypothetical protein [Fimbriimonadaceae bacterium]
MTLVLGIKCSDGIVLGADGAATYVAGGSMLPTIQQNTSKKLRLIGRDMIFGMAGPVGMSQSHHESLQNLIRSTGDKCNFKGHNDAKKKLETLLWANAKDAWERAGLASRAALHPVLEDCEHSTLIACAVSGQPELIQFTGKCSGEFATEELPFVAIGSGQPKADPFLAFVRRIFWPDRLPELSEGVFACLWTLNYVIHADTTINPPVQIATLKSEGGVWSGQELSAEQLQEHQEHISAREKLLRDGPTGPAPEVPEN